VLAPVRGRDRDLEEVGQVIVNGAAPQFTDRLIPEVAQGSVEEAGSCRGDHLADIEGASSILRFQPPQRPVEASRRLLAFVDLHENAISWQSGGGKLAEQHCLELLEVFLDIGRLALPTRYKFAHFNESSSTRRFAALWWFASLGYPFGPMPCSCPDE
jgi:hypothetical protein